jgi:hypothetical protein
MYGTDIGGSTMSLQELIHELRKLNRADKLRAMQVLVTELSAEEEAWLIPGATYEIVTPYGNEAAAQVLYDVLQAADKKAES